MLMSIFVPPYWFVTSKTYFPKTFGWAFDLISMIVNKLSALVSILRAIRVFRAPFWSVREALGCGKDSTKTFPFRYLLLPMDSSTELPPSASLGEPALVWKKKIMKSDRLLHSYSSPSIATFVETHPKLHVQTHQVLLDIDLSVSWL